MASDFIIRNNRNVYLTGNVAGVVKLFNRCGWQAESTQDTTLPHQFMLAASQVA